MLLETKSIIQFALLWGSTWVVASLAIASVLSMALVANFVVREGRDHAARGWSAAVLVALLALNYVDSGRAIGFESRAVESLFYAVLDVQPDPLRRAAVRIGDQAIDVARRATTAPTCSARWSAGWASICRS